MGKSMIAISRIERHFGNTTRFYQNLGACEHDALDMASRCDCLFRKHFGPNDHPLYFSELPRL